jgi:hypothetical protein
MSLAVGRQGGIVLRGHLKTGQLGSPENRPVERIQDTLFLPHL